MIPRHRPPFGPATLLSLGLRGAVSGNRVEDLERVVSDRLDVAHAIWLPSARYGITNAIQFTTASTADVYCPIFNCGAVHHAVQETRRQIQYVDCATDRFLMNCTLRDETCPEHAVVLSEMFGHRFSPVDLEHPLIREAAIRVFDMAMAIPESHDMTRLMENDVAVISFGLGKSLYAGWGTMALTQSADLAEQLRRQRALDLHPFGVSDQLKCFAKMFARTAAHEPWVYKQMRQRVVRPAQDSATATFSPDSHEWHRPGTKAHVAIALRNFKALQATIERKKHLASQYAERLPEYSFEACANTDVALSHFSIRVPAGRRDSLRAYLWDQGVDAGTLFPFPSDLINESEYPNATAASRQVLNLPLSCQLRSSDVAHICDCVEEGLLQCTSATNSHETDSASRAA